MEEVTEGSPSSHIAEEHCYYKVLYLQFYYSIFSLPLFVKLMIDKLTSSQQQMMLNQWRLVHLLNQSLDHPL